MSHSCKGVLVVDDDFPIRESMKTLLEIEGYKVSEASNGKEALEYLMSCDPNDLPGVIFLDIMMPVMDGLEFLNKFHTHEYYRNAPVVVMSANSSFRDKAIRMYSVEQIRKPLDIDDLLGVVRKRCGTGDFLENHP